MVNKHTGSRWFELQSQQGRNPSIIASASGPTKVQFLLSALPTQKDSKFWYYVEALWLTLYVTLTVPGDTTFAGYPEWQLWQILQSVNVQSPILGTLFASQNTRGSVLGNVLQRIGFGYNRLPSPNLLGANGGSSFYVALRYRIPFAHRFLANPMDTAPWSGFLEGGTVTVNVAQSDVLQYSGLPATTVANVTLQAALSMQPVPEARIHTPLNWREHQTPGNSTKHVITDMGSPDGLQGIDQSKGVGIAHLSLLCGPETSGLPAATTSTQPHAQDITSFQIPWRDQPQILNSEYAYLSEYESQGNISRINGAIGAVQDMDFPYVVPTVVPNGNGNYLNNGGAMIFPIVSTGCEAYTSKFQTVSGAKEIDFTFASSAPTAQFHWLGCYFGVFDEQFVQSLVQRIAPGSQGVLAAKTLNKQTGGIRSSGKLAYTPDKIKS